ncbi:MAG: hypothetical protein LBR62_02445 [Puniceicoccales bacterium]|jgi:hypothetical protein|nr:hypothetical protein [Puniceicoccales bacterium]
MPNNETKITTATEEHFNRSHYSDSLTAFAAAWKDPDGLENILEFVAPVVPVTRRFEYKQTDTDSMFYTEPDDLRASGSDFKHVEFVGKSISAKTFNKGLTVRLDGDDTLGENWPERYVHLLMKRLYRNELRRALIALDAHDTEVAQEWGADGNPDTNLRIVLMEMAQTVGYSPNRILFGETAWFKRFDIYGGQENAGAQIAAGMNRSDLADRLRVEEVRLLKKPHLGLQSTGWTGNEIYAFYAKGNLLKDEPSNIKRFSTPLDNGFFRVYMDEHHKYVDITVEHYSHIVVTSPKGIAKIVVT